MSTGGASVQDSGTSEFERTLRRVLDASAPESAPERLRTAIPLVASERIGITGRIRLAVGLTRAGQRRIPAISFAATGLATVAIVVAAVAMTVTNAPDIGSRAPQVPLAVTATARPTATPSSAPTPGDILGGPDCRPVGPVLPWRDRPDPLDAGQPIADAGLHGMPATQAAQFLESKHYCYTFRISSQTWCVPPNGTVRDLAYGPEGELIVWVRPYPMKSFDVSKLPPSSCGT